MANIFDNTAVAPILPQAVEQFAVDLNKSGGLNLAFTPGNVAVAGSIVVAPKITLALTANATNNVYADNVAGTIGVTTAAFGSHQIPLYQLVTNGNAVTSCTDLRGFVYAVTSPSNAGRCTAGGIPTGALNGSNKVFTLPQTPLGGIFVMFNASPLFVGTDYAVAGVTLTLTAIAPNSTNGDTLYVAPFNY